MYANSVPRRSVIASLLVLSLCHRGAYAQSHDTLLVTRGLALPLPRGYVEVIVAPNPVETDLALDRWKAPRPAEVVTWSGGKETAWRAIEANAKGWFADSVLDGCYVHASVEMNESAVMILQAKGNEIAYVNGVPRAGNPYCLKDERESWEPDFDYSRLPVLLEKGANELLFRCGRGVFKALLYPPERPVMLNARDLTIPDFVVGEPIDTEGSIVVVNATTGPLENLVIEALVGRNRGEETAIPVIQRLTVRKIAFRLRAPALDERGTADVTLLLRRVGRGGAKILDTVTIPFRVVGPNDNRKETFTSAIDGSVQYYGINPASGLGKEEPAALFLTLHGASVEAVNQSGSYEPKTWGHIVAPTNRRPYGFNWEEWGRLDALEVLDLVQRRYRIDESRIYLTGHSMGGHGAWHIGSLFPDRFAALAPSAGWISFWTYRFRGIDLADTSAVRRMIRRSTTPIETFLHAPNYGRLGVYILHGADDDNVPVAESRFMAETLGAFHRDFVYHEQPGVGHWWDLSDEPGTDCVDWPPLFDFFARHARPGKERVREVRFITSNPGVSSRCDWLMIDAQIKQLGVSAVDVRFDPGMNRFGGTTENVLRLTFDLDSVRRDAPLTIELDGWRLDSIAAPTNGEQLWLERRGGMWTVADAPPPGQKGSRRCGTFKEAFGNRPIFVFGTKGVASENEWAYSKARFDAEKLWYQGNGSIDVVADVDFDAASEPDRSVILYGSRSTNAAWDVLLAESPVQVGGGRVQIAGRTIRGGDLCCIFVRPRIGSRTADVGVVSGTGIIGMRISNRLPYLSPGIGLPDCTVLGPEVLTKGDDGIILTGFFGQDWGVESGDFVEAAPGKLFGRRAR